MSRVRAAVAAAVAGAVLLSGCSQLGLARESGTPAPPGATKPAVIPATVPGTFSDTAQWVADSVFPGSALISRHGIVALFGPADHRRVALLDAQTGRPMWSSVSFAGGERPRIQLVQHDGRDWAVVWFETGENRVRVLTFDLHGTGIGDGKSPAHSEDFSGSTMPAVTVSSRGILISGVTDAQPFQLWPADGARTSYGTGPALNGKAGVPAAAYNNGFLVSFPDGGFSFASPSGGWPSTAGRPAGGVPNTGRILAVQQGLILASWDQTIGGTVIAVHSAQTGQVLSQQVESEQEPISEVPGPFVVAPETAWAAYGGYLFNLRGDPLSTGRLDLHGGTPVSIYQGVVYLRDVSEAFAPPVSESPSASATPAGSASPAASGDESGSAAPQTSPSASAPSAEPSGSAPATPADFHGWAAVDAKTGVLVDQAMQSVPIGVSSVGAGIFTAEPGQDGLAQLFSVPLR